MMRLIVIAAVSVVGLVACGPGAKIGGGKQGAAEALYAASMPTKAGSDKAATPFDLPLGGVSWSCPQGGTAQLSGFGVDVSTVAGASISQKFTLTYQSCGLAKSEAGTAVYNGSMSVSQSVITGSGGVSVKQAFKGKVQVQGAFDDFIDVDVVQSVDVSALAGTGGVAMTLKGTVATSSGAYAYDEAINVTAGSITADLSKK